MPVIARQADLARADAALLDELAAALDPTDARALAAAPAPLARRAVRAGCGRPGRAAPSATRPAPRSSGCWPWPGARPWRASWPAAGGWPAPVVACASRARRPDRSCLAHADRSPRRRSAPRRSAVRRPGLQRVRPPRRRAGARPVVVGEDEIRARIAELGEQITADYAGGPPLLVCVLKGALRVPGRPGRAIRLPLEVDFMAVSSYGASTRSSGVVRIVKDLDIDLAGRRDPGRGHRRLGPHPHLPAPQPLPPASRPASTCARCSCRQGNQKTEEEPRYVGFEIPPAFVLGYGLDVAERYRNLPYVCEFTGRRPVLPGASARRRR